MRPVTRTEKILFPIVVAVVVSLGYLFQFRSAGPDTLLMGGEKFTPAELDTMEAAFAGANLNGAQRDNDNRIRVPRGQQAKYMAALADKKALPNNAFRYLEDVNVQSSFLDTPDQRERRGNLQHQAIALAAVQISPADPGFVAHFRMEHASRDSRAPPRLHARFTGRYTGSSRAGRARAGSRTRRSSARRTAR